MASGLYASMTPLPFSSEAAAQLMSVFGSLIDLRRDQDRAGEVLDEIYARVGDGAPLYSENSRVKHRVDGSVTGSSWALQCFKTHGFHYHSYSDDEKLLSYRRLLLFSNRGFTAEIYPLDFASLQPSGPLEKFIFEGASMAELEFDGRMVHRFRPLGDGELYAYSVHCMDLSGTDHAAKRQTHAVAGEGPEEIIEHLMKSPELA